MVSPSDSARQVVPADSVRQSVRLAAWYSPRPTRRFVADSEHTDAYKARDALCFGVGDDQRQLGPQ